MKGGTAERDFRPDIQGLRALAVAMVVIYHLYPSLLPGGFVGVDVFFVISGFLITGHLWRGYQRTGKVGLVDFWGRRAKRLVPAASLVLAVTWVASRLVLPATRLADTADQVRASALYFQNWLLAHNAVDYLKSTNVASPVQHFWSLSVEEQFYLLWPCLFLAAAILARLRARRIGQHRGPGVNVGLAVAMGLAGALVLGSLAYSVYDTRTDPAEAYFVTTTRVWELGLAACSRCCPNASPAASRQGWLGWAGLAAVAASPFLLRGTSAFPGCDRPAARAGHRGADRRRLGGGPARPGPAHLRAAHGLPRRDLLFAVPVALAADRAVVHLPGPQDRPVRRPRPGGRRGGPILADQGRGRGQGTAGPAADRARLAVGVHRAGRRRARHPGRGVHRLASRRRGTAGSARPTPAAAVLASKNMTVPAAPVRPPPDDMAQPLYRQEGCLVDQHVSQAKACVFGDTKHPVLTVALVGDSAAGEWFSALQPIAVRRHWKLITEIHSACAWTATMMTDPDKPQTIRFLPHVGRDRAA